MKQGKAVVLLSGGLDSATCLGIARRDGFACYALSFNYGQRHNCELDAARAIAQNIGVAEHVTANIDLRLWGGSALTDDIRVPNAGTADSIPVTYVPARNLIFLAFAASWAEAIGTTNIFIGVNSLDYSGYPDCRPQFITAFQQCITCGTRAGNEGQQWHIHTPLQHLSKAEIITAGLQIGVNYSLTHSCYNPTPAGIACGKCDSCSLRLKGFKEAGIVDPIRYII